MIWEMDDYLSRMLSMNPGGASLGFQKSNKIPISLLPSVRRQSKSSETLPLNNSAALNVSNRRWPCSRVNYTSRRLDQLTFAEWCAMEMQVERIESCRITNVVAISAYQCLARYNQLIQSLDTVWRILRECKNFWRQCWLSMTAQYFSKESRFRFLDTCSRPPPSDLNGSSRVQRAQSTFRQQSIVMLLFNSLTLVKCESIRWWLPTHTVSFLYQENWKFLRWKMLWLVSYHLRTMSKVC